MAGDRGTINGGAERAGAPTLYVAATPSLETVELTWVPLRIRRPERQCP